MRILLNVCSTMLEIHGILLRNTKGFLRAKQNEGTEGVLVECRDASSACIYGNRRQRIKCLTMTVETSDENQFSCPESISKMT